MNWTWLILRVAIGLSIVTLLFLSQRFWYRALWRVTSNWGNAWLRVAGRLPYIVGLVLVIVATADSIRMGHPHIFPRGTLITVLAGLWIFSAVFAYLAVKLVRGADRLWAWMRKALRSKATTAPQSQAVSPEALGTLDVAESLSNPSRRYFFRTATALAGAGPFLGAVYGFAAERLRYQVRRVEIPITNLPAALDGMKIAQLSDIHLSGYMPRAAQILFAQAGMKLLRHSNAQLTFNGASFNLIGVDYQRERTPSGRRVQMLAHVEQLVRRDMPNILLSHNPNSFNRAAELGIELTLSGHTHGGQIQVEILDHRLSPARFITDYVAGLYQRPLLAQARPENAGTDAQNYANRELHVEIPEATLASIYVNRGLGTVGAPVRLGVPPEISLIVLRRA